MYDTHSFALLVTNEVARRPFHCDSACPHTMTPRLIYLSLMRMPTEKAHGLQIVQNCEAFVQQGWQVELWATRRWNTAAMRQVRDWHAHYGVEAVFPIKRLPIIDLMPLAFGHTALERVAFYLHIASFIVLLALRSLTLRDVVWYTRDEWLAYALSRLKPGACLVYEAHLKATTARGQQLQTQVVRRASLTVAVTPPLRDVLVGQADMPAERVLVAHDGYRVQRFADLPPRAEARAGLGWPADAFIVGWMGRLHMLDMDKGVGSLLQAVADQPDISVAIVGGPAEGVAALQQQWRRLGRSDHDFIAAGQVTPTQVPHCLVACDVCVMPHPDIEQFALYTSPLKLFEYMASGCAIVASDLPAWADVVTHERDALLVPPGDATSLKEAIVRLRDDAVLRLRLGDMARRRAEAHHTWSARAAHITHSIRQQCRVAG